MRVNIAKVHPRRVFTIVCHVVGKTPENRLHFDLGFADPQHQFLFDPHLLDERAEFFVQFREAGIGSAAFVFAAEL